MFSIIWSWNLSKFSKLTIWVFSFSTLSLKSSTISFELFLILLSISFWTSFWEKMFETGFLFILEKSLNLFKISFLFSFDCFSFMPTVSVSEKVSLFSFFTTNLSSHPFVVFWTSWVLLVELISVGSEITLSRSFLILSFVSSASVSYTHLTLPTKA